MRTLFAIAYPGPQAAETALTRLKSLQRGQTISIADAVIVTRNADGSIRLDQSVNTTAIGAASGAIWGSLIGLLFLSPLLGAAAGAAAGATAGYATDYGISDQFMRDLASKQAGAATYLFIQANDMTIDRVADALGPQTEIAYTSLPEDLELRFKERLAKNREASVPA